MRLLTLFLLCTPLASFASDQSSMFVGESVAQARVDVSKRRAIELEVLKGQIVCVNGRDALTQSVPTTSMNIQPFVGNGITYLPIFSDGAHFQHGKQGTPYAKKGVVAPARIFFSKLHGDEVMVLNAGSPDYLQFTAAEVKALIVYTDEEKSLLEGAK